MGGILETVVGLVLGGDPIGKITGALGDAYKAKLAATNDADRIDADVTIKRLEGDLAAHHDALAIRLATAGFKEQRLITFLIAAVFVTHLVEIGIGTCFGWLFGWEWSLHVPAFPSPIDGWEGAILLSFFGVQAVSNGVQSIAAGLARRTR